MPYPFIAQPNGDYVRTWTGESLIEAYANGFFGEGGKDLLEYQEGGIASFHTESYVIKARADLSDPTTMNMVIRELRSMDVNFHLINGDTVTWKGGIIASDSDSRARDDKIRKLLGELCVNLPSSSLIFADLFQSQNFLHLSNKISSINLSSKIPGIVLSARNLNETLEVKQISKNEYEFITTIQFPFFTNSSGIKIESKNSFVEVKLKTKLVINDRSFELKILECHETIKKYEIDSAILRERKKIETEKKKLTSSISSSRRRSVELEKRESFCTAIEDGIDNYIDKNLIRDVSLINEINRSFRIYFNKDRLFGALSFIIEKSEDEVFKFFNYEYYNKDKAFASLELIDIVKKVQDARKELENNSIELQQFDKKYTKIIKGIDKALRDRKIVIFPEKCDLYYSESDTDESSSEGIHKEIKSDADESSSEGIHKEIKSDADESSSEGIYKEIIRRCINDLKTGLSNFNFYNGIRKESTESNKHLILNVLHNLGVHLDNNAKKFNPLLKNIFHDKLFFSIDDLCVINKQLLLFLKKDQLKRKYFPERENRDRMCYELIQKLVEKVLEEKGISKDRYSIKSDIELCIGEIKASKSMLFKFSTFFIKEKEPTFLIDLAKLIKTKHNNVTNTSDIINEAEIKAALEKILDKEQLKEISKKIEGFLSKNTTHPVSSKLSVLKDIVNKVISPEISRANLEQASSSIIQPGHQ